MALKESLALFSPLGLDSEKGPLTALSAPWPPCHRLEGSKELIPHLSICSFLEARRVCL